MSLRRLRSGGMHANSEEDFLQKIAKIDRLPKRKTYIEETEPFDGFIVNSSFTFDSLEKSTMIGPSQKSHFILIMIDDLNLSPKRLQNLLENNNYDTLTQSTNDDSNVWSSQVMKQDLITYNYTQGNITHLFNIWVVNSSNVPVMFKQCYYSLFEAYICVNDKRKPLFENVYDQIHEINCKVQQFFINENDETSPGRQLNNIQQILKVLTETQSQ